MIRWVTAFIDCPEHTFEANSAFWCSITGTTRSTARGDTGQFATLVPSDGDAYLRVQRMPVGHGPRVHIDLHVDDVRSAADHALACGATGNSADECCIMRSPGGMPFCFVPAHDEAVRPRPAAIDGGPPVLVDQVTLDIPRDCFDAERGFWREITGWAARDGVSPPFEGLLRSPGMPLRLLFQRLGPDDTRDQVTAHLDASCSGRHADAAAAHAARGATERFRGMHWITMLDPSGHPYCLTARDSVTDRIS